jgi:hypothetical protein
MPRALFVSMCGLAALLPLPAQAACSGKPRVHQAATPQAVAAFVHQSGKRVLTFTGYSAAGYQDRQTMREHAARVLAASSPSRVLVNIGATAEGIGEVYELARQAGFVTMGVVSSLAQAQAVPLSPCVDHVFYVSDNSWGGLQPATGRLSPTSQTIVDISSAMVGLGGGEVARDEMLAAQARGKAVTFIPADMNHTVAHERAQQRGQPLPQDFRGAAHAALAGGS